jgi:hypothetical protein
MTGTVQPFQSDPDTRESTFVNPELAAMKTILSEIDVSDNSSSSFDMQRHFPRYAGREGLAPMESGISTMGSHLDGFFGTDRRMGVESMLGQDSLRLYPLLQDESSRDGSTHATADNFIYEENYGSIHRHTRTEDFLRIGSDHLNSSTNGMQLYERISRVILSMDKILVLSHLLHHRQRVS